MDRNVSGEGIQVQTGQKVAARKIPKLSPSTYLEFSALDHCENFLTKKKRERENEALERRCVCCFIQTSVRQRKSRPLSPLFTPRFVQMRHLFALSCPCLGLLSQFNGT